MGSNIELYLLNAGSPKASCKLLLLIGLSRFPRIARLLQEVFAVPLGKFLALHHEDTTMRRGLDSGSTLALNECITSDTVQRVAKSMFSLIFYTVHVQRRQKTTFESNCALLL